MLYLRWLLTNRVSKPRLQESILGSSLVNLAGGASTFKPIDLALEHINCCYAIDLKMHKNLTHDITKTFGWLALASSFITSLRAAFETAFGEQTNTRHSYKSAVADVFSLAMYLKEEGKTRPVILNESVPLQFHSADILADGLKLLDEKIERFNSCVVATPDRVQVVIEDEDIPSELTISTAEYAEAVDDTFYNDIDPIFVTT